MAITKTIFKPVLSEGASALKLAIYPKIKRPSSKMTTAPSPVFVTSAELDGSLRTTRKDSTSRVWGLTVATFALGFADQAKQWLEVEPRRWQFQGGEIQLIVSHTIYISKTLVGDDASVKSDLVGLIMSHELLHVQDNFDVLKTHGATEIQADRALKSFLVDAGKGEPEILSDELYKWWVFEKTTDATGHQSTNLTARMITLIAPKLNEKQADRDSGPAYADYGHEIRYLRQMGRRLGQPERRKSRPQANSGDRPPNERDESGEHAHDQEPHSERNELRDAADDVAAVPVDDDLVALAVDVDAGRVERRQDQPALFVGETRPLFLWPREPPGILGHQFVDEVLEPLSRGVPRLKDVGVVLRDDRAGQVTPVERDRILEGKGQGHQQIGRQAVVPGLALAVVADDLTLVHPFRTVVGRDRVAPRTVHVD